MKFARPRRAVNGQPSGSSRRAAGVSARRPAAWLAGALVVLALATLAAARKALPFHAWYYHWAWYPTLLALASGYALRARRRALSPTLAISLLFWSAPLWFLFETINLRVANWYYVLAAEDRLARILGAFTAFATVLPAIYLVHRWVESLGIARDCRGPALPLHRHSGWLVAAGLALLGVALWQPRIFFPLIWGFLTLVLEPWNHRRDPERSLLGDLARGRYDRLLQLLLAGAIVGLLWESFNALAGTRWIYTVPGLEGSKLFEMPLPGFLGFPVFALDCFVAYQALVNARLAVPGWERRFVPASGGPGLRFAMRPAVAGAGMAAVGFGVLVSLGMERWTIDSTYPGLGSLPGATAEEESALRAAGVQSVPQLAAHGAGWLTGKGWEPARASELAAAADLAMLRGIGVENAAALISAGIGDACGLARADPGAVSGAVRQARTDPRAGYPPRVRVWVRSAARVCPVDRDD